VSEVSELLVQFIVLCGVINAKRYLAPLSQLGGSKVAYAVKKMEWQTAWE